MTFTSVNKKNNTATLISDSLFHKKDLTKPALQIRTNVDFNDAWDNVVDRWQWHQLDHMQIICTSLNHANNSSLNFYRPDAIPDAQQLVSVNWRQKL